MNNLLRRWCFAALVLLICAPTGASMPVELQGASQQSSAETGSPGDAMEQAEALKEPPSVPELAEGLPLFNQLGWNLRDELPTSLHSRIFLLETW